MQSTSPKLKKNTDFYVLFIKRAGVRYQNIKTRCEAERFRF